MKVLLVRPPMQSERLRFLSVQPPMNLAYLSASLKRDNHNVRIFDFDAFGGDSALQRFRKLLGEFEPNLVGISCLTHNVGRGAFAAAVAKELLPDVTTIAGGAHPSALPVRTLRQFRSFDLICIGEGESTLAQLASQLHNSSLGKVPGIAYREGEEIVVGSPRPLISDLDSLPFPAREMLRMSSYRGQSFRGFSSQAMRLTEIYTTRGCTGACTFCAVHTTMGRGIRRRSVENVCAEMRECARRWKVEHFVISDDSFLDSHHRERTLAICEEMRRLGATFNCNARVDMVDERLLREVTRLGLKGISFGVESGSPAIMKRIRKNISPQQVREIFRIAKSLNIPHIEATFLLGADPQESLADVQKSLRLIQLINPTNLMISVAVPYPGTELYRRTQEAGLLDENVNWEDFQFFGGRPLFGTLHLSGSQLQQIQLATLRNFYLNPANIIRRLTEVRHIGEIAYLAGAGIDFLKILLRKRINTTERQASLHS